jgi:flagellar basal-body rod protein FlgG
MDSGLYTAYSGLRATADLLDVVANNLANVNTTGFKSDETFQKMYNRAVAEAGAGPLEDAMNNSAAIGGSLSNFEPGVMKATGRELDVAIEGKGFLAIQGPSGIYYTRNGSLHLNAEGGLVTSENLPVLGENGPIQIPAGRLAISAGGEIEVEGNAVDTLRIVNFPDKQVLEKVGDSMFRSVGLEGVVVEPGQRTIRQGTLEQSNVNAVREMVVMIDIMRRFEALQKTVFTLMNEINERTIDQVGEVVG